MSCHFLLQGNLPNPGIELASPALTGRFFTSEPPGKPCRFGRCYAEVQLSSVTQHVRLFVSPWTAAHQAFLSITNSRSLLKLRSIGFVLPSNHLIEKVTGRKARGPQMEKIGCKCQIFFHSLYKIKRKFLLKFCVAIDDTWFHLKLTFLKPWANQYVFLMKMFFLSYVSELCIYLRCCLSSSWFCLRLGTDLTNQYVLLNKPVCFTVANILSSYVNETMYLLRNLPFFKIHGNRLMARDDSQCASVISERMLWMRGLVPLSELWDISFLSLQAAC